MAKKDWITKGADGLRFGERLDDLIKLNKTTTAAVAEATGTNQSGISNYINHKSAPTCATIIALAKYFSVSTDYLLGLTSIKTPSTDTQAIISKTGLSEDNVVWLEQIQSLEMSSCNEMVNDLLQIILNSSFITSYVLMKATLDVSAPVSYEDRLKSGDISIVDLVLEEDEQRRCGYVRLSGKEAFEYHCSKIADALEQALIDKYISTAKWGECDGND